MTNPAVTPARPWLPRWMRRLLRLLLRGVVAAAILLLLAWTFRQQLLVPLLRPRVEAELAELLGARTVSIGALEGSWFGDLDVRELVVEGGTGPLRAARGVRAELRYSLWPLLAGDLAGLRAAKVAAADVEIDLRPGAPGAATATAPPDAGLVHAAWQRGLPEGASVHVERLRVLSPHGERLGPLTVDLPAGAGERELVGTYAGIRIVVRAGAPAAAVPPAALHVSCDAEDPGALLDLFALGAGVRGGALHAELDLGLAPLWLQARLELRDLAHGDQRLAKSLVVLHLDRRQLAVERASLDLPGIAVELREMTLPSPLSTDAITLRDLAGRFVVRIDDLAPHAALLPAALRELLPIQGRFAGSAEAGLLHVDDAELRTRGAELTIASGSLPLVSDDWRAAEGAVQFALSFDGFTQDLPWLGASTVVGSCAGDLAGSVAQPRLDLRLDLGACRSDRGGFTSAQGRLRADAAVVAAEGLRVQGLQVAAFASPAPTSVALDASCGLRAWAIEPDSLVARLEIGSLVPEALLAPFFAERGFGPAPTGLATLQLMARHDGNGIAVESLRVRSAPGSPVEVAVDGDGVVPLHWSGTAVTPLAAGAFVLRASARHAVLGVAEPQFACAGTLRVDARTAAVDGLDLAVGPARLRGAFAVERGLAALFEPAAGFASAPLQLTLDLEEMELERLPAAWVGATRLAGRVSGRVRAAGSLRELQPEALLTWTDGELRGEGLPALTGANLRLEVAGGDAATKTLSIVASGSASFDPQLGLDEAVAFTATICSDERGTTLEPSELRIGGGELRVALASNLRRGDLLAGTVDPSRTTLAGAVELREFALEKLPADRLGLPPLRGIVSGEVAVDGLLGPVFGPALLRTAKLSLRDGEIKFPDMPRFERLTAELRGDRHELTLHSLSGVSGAGHFSAKGSLREPAALLADSLATAALELRLDGEDVLLYRGDGAKVRASIHATATGTMEAIAVRGDVQLGRGSKYVRRISVLPALGNRGGAAANEGLQVAQLPPAFGDRVDLDVGVTTREAFEVRTHLVDGDVDVAARLRGKASAPRLEGTMSLRKGMLRFPGANLAIDSGLLTFTSEKPLFPELLVNATGKRMGVVVSMSITGRYDRPLVQLTSVPALPPQDLIVLLTTGQLPSTLAERGATGQAKFVGGYLAKEVFEKYFGSESTERGASLFDRLTIETGREVSQNGTESVLVEYELLPRVSVQVERDAYEDYNLGLVLRFRFR